ncbi:MAG: hypothetical protein FWD09_04825 [Lentimicrobiaceae bacterium]|nr:hypothetical protein [Lentimicrobiaceae bacterium]
MTPKMHEEGIDYQVIIPQGQTREDVQVRKKLIKDFYAVWNAANPTKCVFNINLQDFINVRFLSMQETSLIAALSYKSTFAVTCLTEILEKAVVRERTKPKPNNQNQKRFSEMIIMDYFKEELDNIKLTVGVLKGSKQKVQYCITAIKNDQQPSTSRK